MSHLMAEIVAGLRVSTPSCVALYGASLIPRKICFTLTQEYLLVDPSLTGISKILVTYNFTADTASEWPCSFNAAKLFLFFI